MDENIKQDLLDDKFIAEEIDMRQFFPSKTKRFLHLVGDAILFFIITSFLSLTFASDIKNGHMTDMEVIVFYFTFFSLWFVFEYSFGKTPFKFLTKTKVVTIDGGKPSISAIAIRTLCRIIPIDVFTYFSEKGYGWHDMLSKTRVVNDDFALK